jgi:hypothetical protein
MSDDNFRVRTQKDAKTQYFVSRTKPIFIRTKPIFCYNKKTVFGTHILKRIKPIINPYKPVLKICFFCLREFTAATSSFKALLVVLQDPIGHCPIQTKRKQRRLSELLSIYWVHIWKSDVWNAMHIHSDLLSTSSPAEGKVHSIGGNCSRWRMRASCVIMLASVSIARSVWRNSEVVSMKFYM